MDKYKVGSVKVSVVDPEYLNFVVKPVIQYNPDDTVLTTRNSEGAERHWDLNTGLEFIEPHRPLPRTAITACTE